MAKELTKKISRYSINSLDIIQQLMGWQIESIILDIQQ